MDTWGPSPLAAALDRCLGSELAAPMRTAPTSMLAGTAMKMRISGRSSATDVDENNLEPEPAAASKVSGAVLHFKMPTVHPHQLPSYGMSAAMNFCPSGLPGPPAAISGALRPGCTLLTLDVTAVAPPPWARSSLYTPSSASMASIPDEPSSPTLSPAELAAAAALAGPCGAFFRSLPEFAVVTQGHMATCKLGLLHSDAAVPPWESELPAIRPLVALSTQPQLLCWAQPLAAGGRLSARCHGTVVRLPAPFVALLPPLPQPAPLQLLLSAGSPPACAMLPSQVAGPDGEIWSHPVVAGQPCEAPLPATGLEGCALFDLAPDAEGPPRCTEPSCLLLTTSAAIAAEARAAPDAPRPCTASAERSSRAVPRWPCVHARLWGGCWSLRRGRSSCNASRLTCVGARPAAQRP